MDATVVKPTPVLTPKMLFFGLLWLGQLVSTVGSTLTRFAFGVYVLQETGSATQYALISFFALAPAILVLPIAGPLVDRWDRRWTMIISDTGAGISTVIAWYLLSIGQLETWHIYVLVSINAAFGSFQNPAFNSSIPLLVTKQQLGRANGMIRIIPAVARVVVPAVAGLLLTLFTMQGILLIDLTTFFFALGTILLIRIPAPPVGEEKKERKSFFKEAARGWTYIQNQPGLRGLLMFLAVTNLTLGMVWLLIIPLVLSFTDAAGLGLILALAGSGMLAGGIAMSIWGGPKRRVAGVLFFTFLQGFVLLLGGLQPSAPLVVIAAFIFLFSFQVVMGTERALWQTKVPLEVQGRVHAIHEMVALIATGLAFLLSGPLTDYVFEPLLAPDGALAGTVGQVIGTGDGRGIGFLFIVLGLLTIAATAVASLNPAIRHVEVDIPDAIADEEVATVVPAKNTPTPTGNPKPKRNPILKWLGRLGLLLLFVLILAIGVVVWMAVRPWPQTSGTLAVAGLTDTVRVVRDQSGIPHIYAANEQDLFFAQGYIHAQDRLWQMDYYRRLGNGRFSEILGDRLQFTDRFLRTVGLRRHAERALAEVDAETLAFLQAYCDGVNAYIESHHNNLPIEYTLIQAPAPEPWTPVDVLTLANTFSLQLAGNYRLELLRGQLYAHLGEEKTEELLPPKAENTPLIIPDGVALRDAFRDIDVSALDSIDEYAGDPSLPWGSNNWVVSGERTESGMPILANDPHLQVAKPSTWYINGLHGGRFDVVGFSFAGSPFVVVGQNPNITWGITNVGPDVQDLYMVRLDDTENPTRYEWNGEWRDLEIIQDEIKVKDGAPIPITVYLTHQGPLIDGALSSSVIASFQRETPLVMRWTIFEVGSVVGSLKALNMANDWETFRSALSTWDIPGQNFVYADTAGNIGYQMTGKIPIRPAGHQGLIPMPGWTEEYEWQGYVPYEEMPTMFNPPAGFIATANNKVVGDDYPYLIAYDWWPGYRAQRITENLAADDSVTLEETRALQMDTYSIPAAAIRPYLLQVPAETEAQRTAIAEVAKWNDYFEIESVGAAIYQTWYSYLVQNTIKDDLGTEYMTRFLAGNYHRFGNSHLPMMVEKVQTPDDEWFDDITTTEREDFNAIALRSLDDALAWLTENYGEDTSQWTWGQIHTVTMSHSPLGSSGIPPVEWLANGTPMPMAGDNTTVNNAAFRWNAPFKVWYGTSMRYMVDLGAMDEAQVVLTTGQSGHIFHPNYADMTPMLQQGQYIPLPLSEAAVQANGTSTLTMTPE